MSYGLNVQSPTGLIQVSSNYTQYYLWESGSASIVGKSVFPNQTLHRINFQRTVTNPMIFIRNVNSGAYAYIGKVDSTGFNVNVVNSTGGGLTRTIEWRVYARASRFTTSEPLPAYGLVTYDASGFVMARSDKVAWEPQSAILFSKAEILGASPVYKTMPGAEVPFVMATGITNARIKNTVVTSPYPGTQTMRITTVRSSGNTATIWAVTATQSGPYLFSSTYERNIVSMPLTKG